MFTIFFQKTKSKKSIFKNSSRTRKDCFPKKLVLYTGTKLTILQTFRIKFKYEFVQPYPFITPKIERPIGKEFQTTAECNVISGILRPKNLAFYAQRNLFKSLKIRGIVLAEKIRVNLFISVLDYSSQQKDRHYLYFNLVFEAISAAVQSAEKYCKYCLYLGLHAQ